MFSGRVQVVLQQMYQSIPDIAASATSNNCLNGLCGAVWERPALCELHASNVRGYCGDVPVCGQRVRAAKVQPVHRKIRLSDELDKCSLCKPEVSSSEQKMSKNNSGNLNTFCNLMYRRSSFVVYCRNYKISRNRQNL